MVSTVRSKHLNLIHLSKENAPVHALPTPRPHPGVEASAGLVAAQTLRGADVDLTLLDKRNFHLFQPLLYQVATGSLSPAEIAAPIRAILSRQKNVEVLLGEAVDYRIPWQENILLADGGVFPYDTLIVATGSQTSYYGNDEWRENAPSLKTVEEATTYEP